MSSILEIFFPLCAADPIHWQRRTPDVEHGIWSDVANEQLQQWLQTDAIRLYIPGEWISVWQVELPVVARKQIPTILPALLEEELNQDIDELHFAPLKIDQQLATVAVIHQQHMRKHCAVVAGKRHHPRYRRAGLDVHSLWVYGWRCATGYLPHR
ncbi:type II secretion system protein L [Escherichia coli]|nr:type II secretion system protein L [Escherichia coli]